MTVKGRYNTTLKGYLKGLKRIMRGHYNNKTGYEGTLHESKIGSSGFLRTLFPLVLTSGMLIILVLTVIALIVPSMLSAFLHSLESIAKGNPLGGEYP
ncbi:MAG: hypothetical protein ACYDAP_05920 [Thermoplasmataceae archaeon]